MKLYIIPVISIFIFFSCTREDDGEWHFIGEFPLPITLEGERILKNEFGVLNIYTEYSYLITNTIRDTLFHIYNEKLEYMGGFGKQGEGPYDFLQIGLVNDILTIDGRKVAHTIDLVRNKSYCIDILTLQNSDGPVIICEYELPWDLHGAYLFYQADENTFVGTYRDQYYQRLDGKYGLFYYYPETDSIYTVPLYNLEIFSEDGQPINDPSAGMNINAHSSAISPDRNKFAVQLMYTPRLQLFDLGDPQTVQFLLQRKPTVEEFELNSFYQGNVTRYYNDIQATDNYIYLLYSGHTVDDDENQLLDKTIQVIDWDGNPHRQFLIPAEYGITLLAVDEENGTFYGLSHITDEIYRFNYGTI